MKKIKNTFLLAAMISAIIIASCGGDDTVSTNTTNPDCGDHHTVHYDSLRAYTYTYVHDTVRVFRFSAFPTTTIQNICTHGKPEVSAIASWFHSNGGWIHAALMVNVNAFLEPYQTYGTVTQNGFTDSWDGVVNVGLQQTYGNGPGEILDIYMDFSFKTLGSLSLDEQYFNSRFFITDITLSYEEYRATNDKFDKTNLDN